MRWLLARARGRGRSPEADSPRDVAHRGHEPGFRVDQYRHEGFAKERMVPTAVAETERRRKGTREFQRSDFRVEERRGLDERGKHAAVLAREDGAVHRGVRD